MLNLRFKVGKFRIDKRFYIVVFSALCAIIFAHLFGILTILKKGDNFIMQGYGADIRSGRWGLKILSIFNETFFHIYNLNYLNSLMSLIILSISAYYTILVFNIKKLLYCSIWTIIFLIFPTVTSTLMYTFTILPYFIALFLIIYATYTIERYKYGYIYSVLLIWFGTGIYQAYLTMAISIFALQLITKSISGEYSIKDLIQKGILYALVLSSSVVLYILTSKLFIHIYDIQLTDYQNINSMGMINLSEIPSIIGLIYLTFYRMLSPEEFSLYKAPPLAQTNILKISIVILILVSIYLIIKRFRNKELDLPKSNKIFAILLFILLPIPFDSILIMTRDWYIHALMVYSLVFIYLLPIILLDKEKDIDTNYVLNYPIYKKIAVIFLSFVIIQYTYLSNLNYNVLYFSTQKTVNYVNMITTKITDLDNFNTKLRWAFIGDFNDELFKNKTMKDFKTYMLRMNGITFNAGVIFNPKIFSQYTGYDPKWVYHKELEELKELKIVKDMPNYPDDGSMIIYDDMVIVKFSDE